MQRSLQEALWVVTCALVVFARVPLGLAQDETTAANVDAVTWANMLQVEDGVSQKMPGDLNKPLDILTPHGLYVVANASTLGATAAEANPTDPDAALIQYFNYLLGRPGVAGLLLMSPWKTLNPQDPNANPESVAYNWHPLDDALTAVAAAGKTLQLAVNPGFNSPPWLFGSPYLTSCDFLFITPYVAPKGAAECGYTYIFLEVESGTPTPLRLPLPWSPTYKSAWGSFLEKLHAHIRKVHGEKHVVSITVAGPTASSSEMILPNGHGTNNPGTLTLPPTAVTSGTANATTATAAWNCLLANHYGTTTLSGANYLNTDRAFVEEWDAAIDLYGGIFSGITLVVITGNGLPDFSNETAGSIQGCGLGVSTPAPSRPLSPPAFSPDCDASPSTRFPMDCASETAILAYFSEPPIGGANAKAMEEDALSASDDVVSTLITLSNASVKWLAGLTAGGLAPVVGNPLSLGSRPVMSRMLGGLQFTKVTSASTADTLAEGCRNLACKGCMKGAVCNPHPGTCMTKCTPDGYYCAPPGGITMSCLLLSPAGANVEQALLNALQMYFAGTVLAGTFDAPLTIMNNTAPVTNAPMSYLQVYAGDIQYAAGDGNCTQKELMMQPPSCTKHVSPASMPHVPLGPSSYNAQQLLKLAGDIIVASTVQLPLFGYNNGSSQLCGCTSPYKQRKAFEGDDVCVLPSHKADATAENAGYAGNFSRNETISSSAPYGPCLAGYFWRQAHMGDYVCVTKGHATEVANDNVNGASRIKCPP